MASRKEYELLLKLEAETNGAFSKTFTNAQREILDLQKKIQSLNKTQGDIAAYQKQQQAVEATGKKLDVLKQQYDNIQKEIEETGHYSSDLQNKLLAKQQQIDRTSAALDQQTQKLNQMGDALQEAGVDTANLEKESQRLEAEMGDLKKQQDEAADGAQSFGAQSSAAFNAVSEAIAAAGIAAALHEIYEAYMQCIGVAGDFEESMSNVAALSGASSDELDQLAGMAKELGATTKFTAKESADAMGYMAMAGWDTEQMLAGMPGVLSLAAASGEDLARVSDIVTDSMTAFGLSAADTGRYADVLAAAATNANTTVSLMGDTFKYAAPLAGALKYGVEDVAVATGLMANAGIKGSEAGTTLRNIFTRLAKPTKESADAMEALHISMTDGTGRMYTFMELMEQMRDSFAGLTEEQKTFYAAELAGQRGMSGLMSIVNASEADFEKLSAAITDSSGAAQKMADIKLDNMNGQLTILNSAIEAVETTVGEQFTPVLQDVYSAGAKVMTGINHFLQEHPAVVKAVTAFVAVIGAVTAGVVAYSAATKIAIPLMKLFAASIPGVNIIAGVTLAVAGLTAAVVALSSAQESEAEQARKLTESSRREYEQLQELRNEYENVANAYGATSDQALYLAWQIEQLDADFQANKQTLSEYIDGCEELNRGLNETLDSNRAAFEEAGHSSDTTLALVHRLQDLAAQTDKTVETQEEMRAIIAALNEEVPGLSLNYEDVANGVTDFGAAIEKTVKAQALAERQQAAQKNMVAALNAQYEADEKLKEISAEREAAQQRVNAALEAYNNIAGKYLDRGTDSALAMLAASDETKELEAARRALEAYDAQLTETGETLQKAKDDYEYYKGELVDFAEQTYASTEAIDALDYLISVTATDVRDLVEAYNEAYDAAYSSISGQYALWDEAEKVVATSAGTINSALESQAKYWEDYNSNLQSLSQRTGEIEGLSDVIASFADGSKESVNAIAGMATASDDDLKKMVENWKLVQEQESAASESIADLKTHFTEQMDEMQQALTEDIEAMNMSAEAADAGQQTIQAFIDAANEMLPQVQAAYDRLGLAAARSLSQQTGTTIRVTTNTEGVRGVRGYASGTENAAPGYHFVGENGPELMWFNGGEKVLDAEQTRRLMSEPYTPAEALGGGYGRGGDEIVVSFAPVYQIQGNSQPEEIEAVLREHDADLREQIESILEDIAVDKARCAYR